MLDDFFKPEERRRGEDLLGKDVVAISSQSDTDVRAFIKGSAACKVSLSASEVTSPSFAAQCTCPSARKGTLCKHIWAVILKLGNADFLESKTEIETASTSAPNATGSSSSQRQTEYRKQQYAKQKLRAKDIRRHKKASAEENIFTYPGPVEEARAYFAANGFTLEHPLDIDVLCEAKKLLSRVFHPDKGGTHEETVRLNQNFEIIFSYLKD